VPDAAGILHALDRGIFLVANSTLANPLFDLLMPVLSDQRYGIPLTVVVVLAVLGRHGRRAWPAILLVVLAVALSDFGTGLIKHAVQRVRPCNVIAEVRLLRHCPASFAMPSNHASNMFAAFGAIALLVPRWRWGTLILAMGVAYSRVYLGVHYPSDVVVGAVWGGTLGGTIALVSKRLLPARWRIDQEPTPRRSRSGAEQSTDP